MLQRPLLEDHVHDQFPDSIGYLSRSPEGGPDEATSLSTDQEQYWYELQEPTSQRTPPTDQAPLLCRWLDVYTRDSPVAPFEAELPSSDLLPDDVEMVPIDRTNFSRAGPAYADSQAILMFTRQWHFAKEPQLAVSSSLFARNPDITASMRCKLINWLVEVSLHFRLHRETFYLAVYYLDRYLSLRAKITRSSLQLIGISALFVAAKLEEIYPPTLRDFAEVCAGSCLAFRIAQMEIDMLMALRWHLNVATPFFWLGCFLSILRPVLGAQHTSDLALSTLEILDLASHTTIFVRFPYSALAASALLIRLQHRELVQMATGFEYELLRPCLRALRTITNIPCALVFLEPNERLGPGDYDRVIGKNAATLGQLLEEIKLGSL